MTPISDAVDRITTAQAEFAPTTTYLDTASIGLPPRRGIRALRTALEEWQAGTAKAPEFDRPVEAARARYAELVGAPIDSVAVGSQASALVGLVAGALPAGAEVVVATGDFTSVLFPFHARSLRVREAPLADIEDAVTARTDLVAVSMVQSSDGRLADLPALIARCAHTGTRILLDVTQAAGWLPVDANAVAYTVCAGYKWLLAPRGTAYLTVQPDLIDGLVPNAAGWYAGEHRWDSIYGSPLRLASTARRFDVSPAWHSWIGAEQSLDLLVEVGAGALHEHAVGIANRFRTKIGLPESDSAIVSLDVRAGAEKAMTEARIAASRRAGRVRLAFHLYNTPADADRAADALVSWTTGSR